MAFSPEKRVIMVVYIEVYLTTIMCEQGLLSEGNIGGSSFIGFQQYGMH